MGDSDIVEIYDRMSHIPVTAYNRETSTLIGVRAIFERVLSPELLGEIRDVITSYDRHADEFIFLIRRVRDDNVARLQIRRDSLKSIIVNEGTLEIDPDQTALLVLFLA
jgi:hypothetical protein